jgi:hypothetical protein
VLKPEILDLIAVLCPFGPLRLLIESSRTQQREVPALLYSVNAVWFMMASHDHLKLSNSMLGSSNRPFSAIETGQRHSYQFIQQNFRRSHDGFMRLPDDSHVTVNPFATQETIAESVDHDRPSETPSVAPLEDSNSKIQPEDDEEDGMCHLLNV